MKIILLFFTLVLSSVSFSQLKEAYFQYNIEVEAVDTSLQTKQTVAMLRDSRMELYFAPNKTRVDFKLGNFSMTTVIVDREKDITLMINDGFSGKVAQLGNAESNNVEKDTTAIVELYDDKKVVLGYNCKKLILEEKGVRTEYWYTNEIEVDTKDQQAINPNLPGFPMAFSKVDNGVKMNFQLSNMKESHDHPLDTIFFTTPPEGFQLVNPK